MAASYLLDTSAYWRIQRDGGIRKDWQREIIEGGIALTEATRFEILYSARNGSERMEMAATLDSLFPGIAFTADLWSWVDAAQQHLAERSQRGAGVIDLMLAAVAVEHDLIILNDDKDFAALASVIPEVRQVRVLSASHGR
jgi:predicted nucleic acid-binding protein